MKIDLKKSFKPRDYQDKAVTECMEYFGTNTPYVLAACPGSGKTEMSIDLVIRLLEKDLIKRVLVLAHSTNVLKENFYERFLDYFDDKLVTTYKNDVEFNPEANIHVLIPQNKRQIKECNYDYDIVIVDEAHQNYLADTAQNIVGKIQPKLTLLLTGTPSCFIADRDNYKINVIGMDNIDKEYFHNVGFKLVKSDYKFNLDAYNSDYHISEHQDFKYEETKNTINHVILSMVSFIANREGVELSENFNKWDKATEFFNENKFGKTLFICRRIEQAHQVSEFLNINGIECDVSDSKNDSDSNLINDFKNGKINVLCVVGRCKEGYNDPDLINIVDISMTHNIDLIYQMYARIVRKNENYNKNKLYIKLTPDVEGMPEYTMSTVSAALMLSNSKYLGTFNGSNFNDLVAPRFNVQEGEEGQVDVEFVPQDLSEGSENDNNHRVRRLNEQLSNDIIDLFIDCAEQICVGNTIFGKADMLTCKKILQGNDLMGVNETFDLCVKNELTSTTKYRKFREENEELKLPSDPWDHTGEKLLDYFMRVRNELGINEILDVKETFDLCVENELISKSKYLKFREENKDLILHSGPWNCLYKSVKEYFQEIKNELGVNDELISSEETFDICLKNELTSTPKYKKFKKENSDLKLHSTPWSLIGETCENYFKKVKSKLGINDELMSIEDTFNICVENELISYPKYKKFRVENNYLKLSSAPWIKIYSTSKEYFKKVKEELGIVDELMNIEETFNICVENELINGTKYLTFRKENNYLNLPSTPWSFTNISSKEYFQKVKDELGIGGNFINEEKTFDLCLKNELTSSSEYAKFRKENDHLNLHSSPWRIENKSSKEYFQLVKNELGINDELMSPEETFEICIENKLIGQIPYKKYRKENIDLNLPCVPWERTKESSKEYFKKVKEELGINEILDIKETFKICVENELINGTKYLTFTKENKELKLLSAPWNRESKTQREYFQKVTEELNINYDLSSIEDTFQICVENKLENYRIYKNYRKENGNLKLPSIPWKRENKSQGE